MRTPIALLIAATMFITPVLEASSAKLKVGDKAPELAIGTWINGDAVQIEEGQCYLVEFWATWCGPCRKSIPHLNKMHKSLGKKGLTIIGVSNETPAKVKSFVRSKGDGMSYLVGVDKNKETSRNWMEAAGKKGIPCCFLVGNNQKILFIGHPADSKLSKAIEDAVGGKFDPELEARAAPTLEAARRAAKLRNYADAHRHYAEVIGLDPIFFSDVAFEQYRMAKAKQKNSDKSRELVVRMIGMYAQDPEILSDLIMMLSSDPDQSVRNMVMAKAAAVAMSASSSMRDPNTLATLAHMSFLEEDHDQAVELQMNAWMLADPDDKPAYRAKLDYYRAKAEAPKASKK